MTFTFIYVGWWCFPWHDLATVILNLLSVANVVLYCFIITYEIVKIGFGYFYFMGLLEKWTSEFRMWGNNICSQYILRPIFKSYFMLLTGFGSIRWHYQLSVSWYPVIAKVFQVFSFLHRLHLFSVFSCFNGTLFCQIKHKIVKILILVKKWTSLLRFKWQRKFVFHFCFLKLV